MVTTIIVKTTQPIAAKFISAVACAPLDRALIEITASASWRTLEPLYFGR
jgi:hypothetical protein